VDTLDEALAVVEAARDDFLRRHKVILPPVAEEPAAVDNEPLGSV